MMAMPRSQVTAKIFAAVRCARSIIVIPFVPGYLLLQYDNPSAEVPRGLLTKQKIVSKKRNRT
jgi:hypothetical protein